jgi:CBS domain-containing protein
MKTVKDILAHKGGQIWKIRPEDSVLKAIQIMERRHVGALVALRGKQVVGIVSERDCVRKAMLKGRSSKTTPVSAIMTKNVIYVAPERTVDECMALMTEKRVRHLPVFESGQLVGVVSIGDVVRAAIAEKEFIIEQLEKYITGG